MLKHSNSVVTYVSLQISIPQICPNIPRFALGNVWVSHQAEDPQVACHREAAMRPTNLSRFPRQVFSEAFPALTKDCAFKEE